MDADTLVAHLIERGRVYQCGYRVEYSRVCHDGASGPPGIDLADLIEELDHLISRLAAAAPAHRGRPPGSSPFADTDRPLVEEGAQMVVLDEISPTEAARRLADRAQGANYDAKVDRLRKAISKKTIRVRNQG
jgi:hypothetical protein